MLMLESSPNLSSQLLLVFENEQKDGFRVWTSDHLTQQQIFKNSYLNDWEELRDQIWRGLAHWAWVFSPNRRNSKINIMWTKTLIFTFLTKRRTDFTVCSSHYLEFELNETSMFWKRNQGWSGCNMKPQLRFVFENEHFPDERFQNIEISFKITDLAESL